MNPIHIRNVGGDKNEQIMSAVESICRSVPRLEVFEAICKGKKKEKSVSWIRENTSLKSNKRVTEVAKILVKDEVIHQLDYKVDGETGYTKIDFLCNHKNKILKLIKDKNARKKFPTKYNPKNSVSTKLMKINVNIPQKIIQIKSISIQEIDEFSKIKKIKSMEYDLEKNEDDIKELFKKIIGERGIFKDWPGEKNDLFTYVKINGKKHLAAFAFKGKSKKTISKLRPKDMGKHGDQVERLFSSPAEIFFVQFVGQIDESMVKTMVDQATLKSIYNKKIYYGIIDGSDTSKIFAKYEK